MFVTRLKLKNWRNFRDVDVRLGEYTYILGANASGKSNLLDVFRFLHDISKPQGGGLQKAIEDRRGIKKLRCLHARRDTEVRIEVHLSPDIDADTPEWEYHLAFKSEGKGVPRLLISEEKALHRGKRLLLRPNAEDEEDDRRLTQTYLEQIQANAAFREIADFFSDATYLHLVPQFLKFGDRIGGRYLDDDPFGQDFLRSVAVTRTQTRNARLKKIENALSYAVPQFETLQYRPDEMGHPHLQAKYIHHRPQGGWQREEQFSDGTLRLIGMLWSLLENNSLLLLEEPELSLNNAIIVHIPLMMQRIQKESKRRRQVIITTHSDALLSNKGIDGRGIVLLDPTPEGTKARPLNEEELMALGSGLSVAEVALPKTRPERAEQFASW